MALSAFAWPLRTVLRHQADSFGGSDDVGSFCKTSDRTVVLYGYGICWVASFLSYLFIDMDAVASSVESRGSSWTSFIGPFFRDTFHYVTHALGVAVLVALHVYLRREPDGWLTWVLLAYTYVPLILFPAAFAYAPQCSMLCKYLPVISSNAGVHARSEACNHSYMSQPPSDRASHPTCVRLAQTHWASSLMSILSQVASG